MESDSDSAEADDRIGGERRGPVMDIVNVNERDLV